MRVEPAGLEDVEGWLALAREVEPLFGPMVESADFQAAADTRSRFPTPPRHTGGRTGIPHDHPR
jgi:hypothetical protein